MTKQTIQYVNSIHNELWEISNEGEVTDQELENAIIKEAGYTVRDKYREQLKQFDRIEKIPDTDYWIVNKPEQKEIDKKQTGEFLQKNVRLPKDVVEAAEKYGVSFQDVFIEALIEEVSNKENFIKDYIGEEYSSEESDYIFKLLKNDLEAKKGTQRDMARRGKKRRDLYRETVDEEIDIEHIEELRKKAFKLKETLNA